MSLPEEWESSFKEADLVEGRRLYTEGLVRQIELKPESAEAVTRTESQTVRAVIEVNGAKLEWRTSLPEEENGAPFAVASIYEIEELIADEIPAIDESAAAAVPEAPKEPERKDANARASLKLQVSFKLSSDGLKISAAWAGRPCLELFRSRRHPRRRTVRRAAPDPFPFQHRRAPRGLRLQQGHRRVGHR